MVQIRRHENIEHKSMKQVYYCGKYFFSACRAHQSHLQFSFVVRDGFCQRFLRVGVLKYKKRFPTKKENWRGD